MSSDDRYVIEMSSATVDSLLKQFQQAVQDGWGEQFSKAFADIQERLKINPWEFGESLYILSPVKLTICIGMIRPVSVEFGITIDRPVVFIRKVTYLKPIE